MSPCEPLCSVVCPLCRYYNNLQARAAGAHPGPRYTTTARIARPDSTPASVGVAAPCSLVLLLLPVLRRRSHSRESAWPACAQPVWSLQHVCIAEFYQATLFVYNACVWLTIDWMRGVWVVYGLCAVDGCVCVCGRRVGSGRLSDLGLALVPGSAQLFPVVEGAWRPCFWCVAHDRAPPESVHRRRLPHWPCASWCSTVSQP